MGSSVDTSKATLYEVPFVEPAQQYTETVVHCSVMAQATSVNQLLFTQLHTNNRNVPAKHWKIDNLGISPRWFEIDHSQDLLVVADVV